MNTKEALETLKSFVENTDNVIAKDAILALHPELAESDDERIGNLIYCIVRDKEDVRNILKANGVSVDNALAYLEKQKEQRPTINIEHLKSYLLQYLQDAPNRKEDSEIDADTDKWTRMIIKVFGGIEQKPAEWTEEDEKLLDFWLDVIDRNDWRMDENFCKASREFINRLKSIRPQPQRRDTYYDIIHYILATLKDMDFTQITPEHRISLLNDIRVKCKNADGCAAILNEPHWKPSEEQMDILDKVYHYLWADRNATADMQDGLGDFIDDLKTNLAMNKFYKEVKEGICSIPKEVTCEEIEVQRRKYENGEKHEHIFGGDTYAASGYYARKCIICGHTDLI